MSTPLFDGRHRFRYSCTGSPLLWRGSRAVRRISTWVCARRGPRINSRVILCLSLVAAGYALPSSTPSIPRRPDQPQSLPPRRQRPVDQSLRGFDRGLLACGLAAPDRALIEIDGPIPSGGCAALKHNVGFVAIFHVQWAWVAGRIRRSPFCGGGLRLPPWLSYVVGPQPGSRTVTFLPRA
jgi:hypothetical protein